MNLKTLNDSELLERTRHLVDEERRITTSLLHYLREIETRKLHLERGFASLFEYLVQGLGYSEAAAQRRISAMRLLRELPEIEGKIQSGELSLSVITRAQTLFRQESAPLELKREILKSLEHKSTREAERELLKYSSNPEQLIPERVRPVTENSSEVRFIASAELLEDLDKLKGLLAHTHPHLSLAELFQLLAKMAIQKLNPARESARARVKTTVSAPEVKAEIPSPRTRAIPSAIRREIWKRDGGRCTYIDPETGRRCWSRFALQIDHKIPWSLGGTHDLDNLRLCCAQHNRLHARNLPPDSERLETGN